MTGGHVQYSDVHTSVSCLPHSLWHFPPLHNHLGDHLGTSSWTFAYPLDHDFDTIYYLLAIVIFRRRRCEASIPFPKLLVCVLVLPGSDWCIPRLPPPYLARDVHVSHPHVSYGVGYKYVNMARAEGAPRPRVQTHQKLRNLPLKNSQFTVCSSSSCAVGVPTTARTGISSLQLHYFFFIFLDYLIQKFKVQLQQNSIPTDEPDQLRMMSFTFTI